MLKCYRKIWGEKTYYYCGWCGMSVPIGRYYSIFWMWDDHAMLEFHQIHGPSAARPWSNPRLEFESMPSWWEPGRNETERYIWRLVHDGILTNGLWKLSGNTNGGYVAFHPLSCKANSSNTRGFAHFSGEFRWIFVGFGFFVGRNTQYWKGARCNVEIWHYILEGPLVYLLCRDSHKYVWKRLDIEVQTA